MTLWLRRSSRQALTATDVASRQNRLPHPNWTCHAFRELKLTRFRGELLRNVGDGRVQAASGCWLTASMPSTNFMPVISFGNWL